MMSGIVFPLLAFATLYEQSAERLLRARFTAPNVSYVVVAADAGRTIASRWPDPDRPVPVGSLVKPLLAAGMPARAKHRCNAERCWLRVGHGELDLAGAIANSCNSYFLEGAAAIDADGIADVVQRFGLPAPADARPETLVGFGRNWEIPPASLIAAYRILLMQEGHAEIRAGMRIASQRGTAHLLGIDALAKTGTAPCSHTARAAGDGFVFAAWPPEQVRYLVLVRVHNTTGANAARTAGEVLRALRDGR